MYVNSDMSNYQTIYTIPPFLGYILDNIGRHKYNQSLITIGKKLGIEANVLQHFVSQLIEQPCKSVSFMGKELFFPEHLLIYSEKKDNTNYLSIKSFSPFNDFVRCRPLIPINVNFMVTEHCNTNCIYCYAKRDTRKEMATTDFERIFKKLSLSGVINLTLTGGDIFARKDWYEIISLSRKFGFGSLISTKTILTEHNIVNLKRLGVNEIQFSLDSTSANVLNKVIKVKSEYVEQLKVMFENCIKHDLKISLRTVLCKLNSHIENIKGLCDFVNIYTCISNWTITPAFYSENQIDYKKYSVGNEELKEIFLYLKEQKIRIRPLFNKLSKDGYILQRAKDAESFVETNQICYANTYSMSILPTGDCTVCEMLYYNRDFIIGNIKEMTVDAIWNSDKALMLYSPIKENVIKESACYSCGVFDKCKKGISKRICYVDIMKVHKHIDFPDPKCPNSRPCNYIL